MFFKINAFRRARLQAGMTQLEAAEKIGVHPVTILSWEKGTNEPTKKNVEKLAQLYGVSIDELVKGESD